MRKGSNSLLCFSFPPFFSTLQHCLRTWTQATILVRSKRSLGISKVAELLWLKLSPLVPTSYLFFIPILSFSLLLKDKKLKKIDPFHLPNVFLFHFYVGIPDVEEFYQQCDPGKVLFRKKLFFCCFCFGRFLWCFFSSLDHWIGLISEVEGEDYFEFGLLVSIWRKIWILVGAKLCSD